MMESEARLDVFDASAILTTVATNWMHRFPVRYDAMTAEVQLGEATLVMTADTDGLSLSISAEDEATLAAAQDTVEKHVDQAAGDQAFQFYWTMAGTST